MKYVITLFFLAVLSGVMVGCNGEDATQGDPEEGAPETETSEHAESGDDSESDAGNDSSGDSDTNSDDVADTLPDNFPLDIPFPDGAYVTDSFNFDGIATIHLEVEAPESFYEEAGDLYFHFLAGEYELVEEVPEVAHSHIEYRAENSDGSTAKAMVYWLEEDGVVQIVVSVFD
ncbi:hypothetical protein [Evansella tamaricis]|uniref:Lipoprotein n=1 Tax=Evansella tamaricis TaxID=2069301 RepID=A0ABS6JDY6_9BACI|nr:hypothetical protein [Evansella tamaricis]MBU9711861.1 hypothetical protein [Evansella tamaricis]